MPCVYETDWEMRARLKNELDDVTRMLCSVMKVLARVKKIDIMARLPEDVTTWWEKHKEIDRKRMEAARALKKKLEDDEKRAALREQVLKRLTSEERKALGI